MNTELIKSTISEMNQFHTEKRFELVEKTYYSDGAAGAYLHPDDKRRVPVLSEWKIYRKIKVDNGFLWKVTFAEELRYPAGLMTQEEIEEHQGPFIERFYANLIMYAITNQTPSEL